MAGVSSCRAPRRVNPVSVILALAVILVVEGGFSGGGGW